MPFSDHFSATGRIFEDEHRAAHTALATETRRLHRFSWLLLGVTLVNLLMTLVTLVLRP
jgi:membrane protein required for beta-lactamase induction